MAAVPRRALVGLALPPALTLALSVASCRDADPARLQANVRLAAPTGRGLSGPAPAPAAAASRPADDRIDELLAAVAAGREGDGLPARIEAVLRRDDAAVRAALAFMRGEKATKLVVDALAAAATPAAQEALCDLARDRRLTQNVRARAVASLGLLRRPTAATMTAVAELTRADVDAESAVGPALFLAGSVARAGRADHPTEAAALEKLVLARSARARSSADLVESLAALGNLGSAAVLPRLRAALAAGDPGVRAAGARALRLVPDPEADRLLAATLRGDHDPTVRAAALFAAGFRKLGPLVDALVETAENDPIEYVRSGAVTLLVRKRHIEPGR